MCEDAASTKFGYLNVIGGISSEMKTTSKYQVALQEFLKDESSTDLPFLPLRVGILTQFKMRDNDRTRYLVFVNLFETWKSLLKKGLEKARYIN